MVVGCTREYEFRGGDFSVGWLEDREVRYQLIDRGLNQVIGKAFFSIEGGGVGRRFYEVNYFVSFHRLRGFEKVYVELESRSVVDFRFKLYSFRGRKVVGGEGVEMRGYYWDPYFYIVEGVGSGKRTRRIYVPGGIYSSLLELHLIENVMEEEDGWGLRYRFLNLVSLKLEEEVIEYEGEEGRDFGGEVLDLRVYEVKNEASGTSHRIWYSEEKGLIMAKEDFDGRVLWRLE